MCLYSRGEKPSKIIYKVLKAIKMAQGSSKVIESTRMTQISKTLLKSVPSPHDDAVRGTATEVLPGGRGDLLEGRVQTYI